MKLCLIAKNCQGGLKTFAQNYLDKPSKIVKDFLIKCRNLVKSSHTVSNKNSYEVCTLQSDYFTIEMRHYFIQLDLKYNC